MFEIDSNFRFKFPAAENRADLAGNGVGINWWGRRRTTAAGTRHVGIPLSTLGKTGILGARPFTAR
jgi:hypothetical protein